jgi:SAM-dependent methyltransferase
METSHLRKTYEKYPYPAADDTALTKERWTLAPMDWIRTLWKPENPRFIPSRILVAGCGTGSEAFALRRKFPKARIIAIDLSPRSISIAKTLQKKVRAMRNIRFFVADLADLELNRLTGGDFDFISCHGVLSYIPHPSRVLKNLAHCLKPDGAIFLGVNGSEHFSVRGRAFLPVFGVDVSEMRDVSKLYRLLRLWDSFDDRAIAIARLKPGYLAGDLFGKLFHNLPLEDWLRIAGPSHLHLQGSYSCWRKVRSAMGKEFHQLLFPRLRSEVCRLLELMAPSVFHRLLFTQRPEENPDWQDPEKLQGCYPRLTNLYSARLPSRKGSRRGLREVTFKSKALNTRLDWKMPEWELELLRKSNGHRPLDEIIARVRSRIPRRQLQEQLYILHQLLVIALMPKAASPR